MPAWFEIGLLGAVMVVVCCGGFGLALAVGGVYSVGLSLGVGLPLAAGLTALGARALVGRAGERPDTSGGTAPAVAAVALALGSAVLNAWRSGEWLNIDRDPAAYLLAGRWLSEHGGLQIPFGDSWAATGVPVTGGSAAVFTEGDHLEFQFNHLLPVLLAQVRGVAGERALLGTNAVIAAVGLLAVYVVAVRLTRRPWIALVATATLGLSLPVLYVARATFSEAATMLLVWAGAWLLTAAWDRAPFVLGSLGGAALGAAAMARVDSLVYLLVLPLLAAAVAVAGARDDRWRRIATLTGAAVLGAVAPVAVGTVDVVARAGEYYRDLSPQVRPLQMATVAAVVVGVVIVAAARPMAPLTQRIAAAVAARRAGFGRGAAAVVVVVLLFAWAVRPAIDHPAGRRNSTVFLLQQAEGLADQPGRLYAERSMVWMSWYLGPVALALGIVGAGLLVLLAAKGRPAALVVLAVAGVGSALYLYRLSNTPDQLFGVRRFVPATMPLFALALAVTLASIPRRVPEALRAALGERWQRWQRWGTAFVVVAVLAFPFGTVLPVLDFSPRRGSEAMFAATCTAIGPDAAVLFVRGSYGALTYPQVVRDFCDVPVAVIATAPSADALERAATAWAADGRTLWLLDDTAARIATLAPGGGEPQRLGRVGNRDELAETLSRPPTYHVTWNKAVYGVRVPG